MINFVGSTLNISPSFPVVLGCGNGSTVSPDASAGNLEVNIMILWSQDRLKKIVFISVDTLYCGPDVSEAIIDRLSPVFEDNEIFLSATHTHNAPMIDETKPLLGRKEQRYGQNLVDKVVGRTLELARAEPQPVNISQRKVNVSGIVSRRKPRLLVLSRKGLQVNRVLQRPNRRERIKPSATVADFVNARGQVLGSIVVFPCHPVAQMGLELISPDFVGPLRNEYRLNSSARADTPFVFLQGSSGDLNPWIKARFSRSRVIEFLDRVLNGEMFFPFTESELSDWTRQRVIELMGPALPQDHILIQSNRGVLSSQIMKIPLGGFLQSAEKLETRKIEVHGISVESLRIVGISAELTWALRSDLQESLNGSELVGCIRDSFGYLSSERQENEGGYESFGHQESFSIASGRDRRFLQELSGLVRQASSDSGPR